MSLSDNNTSDFEDDNNNFINNNHLEPYGALYGSFGEEEWGEEMGEEGGEEGRGGGEGGRGRPSFVLLEKKEVYEGLAKKAKEAGEIFNLSCSTAIQVLSRIQVCISHFFFFFLNMIVIIQ